MLFSSPVPFDDAVRSREVRSLLPTSLSSADLQKLPAEIRERATFSARVPYVGHLSKLDRIIGMIVDPSAAQPGQYMNESLARKLLRESLADEGYEPSEDDAGTIKDLSSVSRIHLQVQMGVDFARGYGRYAQGMDPDVLNEFPAQRLLPSIAEHPRTTEFWDERWAEAGLPDTGDDLVALKTDPGWFRLSIFGLPYPPFDFGSERWLEDVDRDEAEDLGLISPEDRLQAQCRPFADGMTANLPIPSLDLIEAILNVMPGATFEDGVLTQISRLLS